MFRDSYQSGLLTLMTSVGSNPLRHWETHQKDGYVTRFIDPDIKSMVLEICGNNVSTTYLTCPRPGQPSLGITMPFLVMVVKNLKKYFTFQVTIVDVTGFRRRFRVANFQSTTCVSMYNTSMPIRLEDGWNQIHFNLLDFTRRAYNKQYKETAQVKINANIRIKIIYFANRIYRDKDLPAEFKLFFPIPDKDKKVKEEDKENIDPQAAAKIAAVTEEAPPKEMTFPTGGRSTSDIFPKKKESFGFSNRRESSRIGQQQQPVLPVSSERSLVESNFSDIGHSLNILKPSLSKELAVVSDNYSVASGFDPDEQPEALVAPVRKQTILENIDDIHIIAENAEQESELMSKLQSLHSLSMPDPTMKNVLEGVGIINKQYDSEVDDQPTSSFKMSGFQTPTRSA